VLFERDLKNNKRRALIAKIATGCLEFPRELRKHGWLEKQ
jgi:hypothetical protein